MRTSPVVALCVLAAVAGCADILGFETFVAGAPDTSDAGPDGGDGTDEADWYVSAVGDDANDGSRERPLRSLHRALLLASTTPDQQPTAPRRIAVCIGEYPEPALVIKGAIDVRGGYDCATWTRPPVDGAPIGVGFKSGSKLINTEQGAAFVALDQDSTGSPRLDGFRIEGKDVSSVVLVAGGSAHLTELSILNATIPSPEKRVAQPIVAVVLSDSTATLERSSLMVAQNYGISATDDAGGLGLIIDRGAPVVRRNDIVIDMVMKGCQGIAARSAISAEVVENVIVLGSCITTGATAGAVGIVSVDSVLKSTRNGIVFEAPGSNAPTTPAIVAGVNVIGHGAFESDGDRIIAPRALHDTRIPSSLIFHGLQGSRALTRVVNASILVDSRSYALDDSTAILLAEPSTTVVAHNSMYFSASAAPEGGGPPMRAIYVTDKALAGGGAVTVASNLVVTDDPRMGFLRGACDAPAFAQLAHNRYSGFAAPAGGRNCSSGPVDTVWPSAAADGNVAITCPSEGCFKLFTAADLTSLEKGLPLSPDSACGLDLEVPSTAGVTSDGSGAPRGDAGTTAGAFVLTCN